MEKAGKGAGDVLGPPFFGGSGPEMVYPYKIIWDRDPHPYRVRHGPIGVPPAAWRSPPMREEPCPCGRCRQGIRRLRRSGQRSPPVREVLRLYVRGSCGFPAIPARAESVRRTVGVGNGGIRRQRAASGVPSAILRHSLRWLWRPVCCWKAFRIPCDAAPVLGVPVPGSA